MGTSSYSALLRSPHLARSEVYSCGVLIRIVGVHPIHWWSETSPEEKENDGPKEHLHYYYHHRLHHSTTTRTAPAGYS